MQSTLVSGAVADEEGLDLRGTTCQRFFPCQSQDRGIREVVVVGMRAAWSGRDLTGDLDRPCLARGHDYDQLVLAGPRLWTRTRTV